MADIATLYKSLVDTQNSLVAPGTTVKAPQGTDVVGAYSSPKQPVTPSAPAVDPMAGYTGGLKTVNGVTYNGVGQDGKPIVVQQTPAPGANIDPTIANSGVRRYTGDTASPYMSAQDQYYQNLSKDFTAQDESTIRQNQRNGVQELIDNIKNYYSGEIARKQKEGENITGAARAASARGGTLGQDFGNTEMAKARGVVDANVAAVEQERDAAINTILTQVNNRSDDLVQKAKDKAQANTESYLTYLKGKQDEGRTDATNLAKLGHSFDDLSPDDVTKLMSTTGYTKEQLQTLFALNKPQDKVLTSFTQGNKYYVVSQDPLTGKRKTETVDLGFDVPTNWQHQQVGDGIMFFDPANPKNNYIYNVAPSEKDQLDMENKRLQNKKLAGELAGGGSPYKFSNDDRGKLINTNFSSSDIANIENDVNAHGVDAALAGITDPKQKAALQEVLQGKAAAQKVTQKQVSDAINFGKDAVSQEQIASQLKNVYSNDDLEKLTKDAGYSWIGPVTDSDIADYLASPEARAKYAEIIYGQYKDQGLAE